MEILESRPDEHPHEGKHLALPVLRRKLEHDQKADQEEINVGNSLKLIEQ